MSTIDSSSQRPVEDEGLPPESLSGDELIRELAQLHRTRHETFLHAPTQALQRHSERTVTLEMEYLRRHPERNIDERRLRPSTARGER